MAHPHVRLRRCIARAVFASALVAPLAITSTAHAGPPILIALPASLIVPRDVPAVLVGGFSATTSGTVRLQRLVAGGWHTEATQTIADGSTFAVGAIEPVGFDPVRVSLAGSAVVSAPFVVDVERTTSPAALNTLWQWGVDGLTPAQPSVPVPVTSVSGFTQVSALAVSVALRFNGSVFAWGEGTSIRTSDPPPVPLEPQKVHGLSAITAVAAMLETGIALRADGTVWTWRLGPGDLPEHAHPTQVPGLSHITAIAGATSTGYALHADGRVSAWGLGDQGALGDGSTASSATPVTVTGLRGVVAIAAGFSNGAFALLGDGTVRGWGENDFAELGMTSHHAGATTPVTIPGLNHVRKIAAGSEGGIAVVAGGVDTWGDDSFGQRGLPTFNVPVAPRRVPGLSGATLVAAGDGTDYAVKGVELSWGAGEFDTLGNGGTGVASLGHLQLTPGPVLLPLAPLSIAGNINGGYAITAL